MDDDFYLMDDDFILPKNWYVIINHFNVDVLSKWRFGSDSSSLQNYIGGLVGISLWNNGDLEKGHNPKGNRAIKTHEYDFGLEISFDQFRKYVLKEEIIEEHNDENLDYLIKLLFKNGIY